MLFYITALSFIDPYRCKPTNYTYDNSSIQGIFANEAPVRCAIRELAKKGELIEKFILFMSYDCVGTKLDLSNNEMVGNVANYISDLKEVTTYEYFCAVVKEEIMDVVKKYENISVLLQEEYFGSVDEYIHEVMGISDANLTIISDNPDISELKKAIQEGLGTEETMRIYMDITGGSRISSLVAMLFSNWYEQNWNATVESILYASFMSGKGKLIDWTSNYDIIQIADPRKRLEDLGLDFETEEALKKLGNIQELTRIANDAKEVQRLDEAELAERKKKLEMARNLLLEESPAMETIEQLRFIQKGIDNLAKSNIEKIREQEDNKKFIIDFYGTIVDTLYSKDYLTITGRHISERYRKKTVDAAIQCCRNYYCDARENGVIKFCLDMLTEFKRNLHQSPNELLGQMLDLGNIRYSDWREPRHPIRGANTSINEHFMKRVLTRYKKIKIEPDNFLGYERIRNIYYNYGFPFCCIDKNNWHYDKVQEDYIKAVKSFVRSKIQPLWNQWKDATGTERTAKQEEYLKVIEMYADKEALEVEIPIRMLPDNITVNVEKFNNAQEADQFFTEFAGLYEEARKFRNAVSHPEMYGTEMYMNSDEQNRIREKIAAWEDKYMLVNPKGRRSR